MAIDINKEYEKNYNRLSDEDKNIVDESLKEALSWNHVNICADCAKKLFAFNGDIDFTKTYATISEDFAIDNNVCDGTICECGDCENPADYTVNLIEEDND